MREDFATLAAEPAIADPLEPTPEAAMLCSDEEWLDVLRRLQGAGLLGVLDPGSVAKDPSTGQSLQSGAFALVKKCENG